MKRKLNDQVSAKSFQIGWLVLEGSKQNQVDIDFGESESLGYILFHIRSGYGFVIKKHKLDFLRVSKIY